LDDVLLAIGFVLAAGFFMVVDFFMVASNGKQIACEVEVDDFGIAIS
jgi:hypothetical protein